MTDLAVELMRLLEFINCALVMCSGGAMAGLLVAAMERLYEDGNHKPSRDRKGAVTKPKRRRGGRNP
ncbi:MAG TPA: hypothetical protein VMY37_07625 [Thermoguttaceae bacterium]|nr:hypothetical protein [Thermoguttaceae bacterium]